MWLCFGWISLQMKKTRQKSQNKITTTCTTWITAGKSYAAIVVLKLLSGHQCDDLNLTSITTLALQGMETTNCAIVLDLGPLLLKVWDACMILNMESWRTFIQIRFLTTHTAIQMYKIKGHSGKVPSVVERQMRYRVLIVTNSMLITMFRLVDSVLPLWYISGICPDIFGSPVINTLLWCLNLLCEPSMWTTQNINTG